MRAIPLLTLLALGAGAARAEPGEKSPPDRAGEIAVEVTGFRSDKGTALVAVYASARGFPDQPDRAPFKKAVAIHGRTARTVFRRVPPGTYAVGVLHDEDGDHRMKIGFLGIPKEGYGASRDARGRFGPPRFEDARLPLGGGQKLTSAIRMIYH